MKTQTNIDSIIKNIITVLNTSSNEVTYGISGMIFEDHSYSEDIIEDYNQCYFMDKNNRSVGFFGDDIDAALNIKK